MSGALDLDLCVAHKKAGRLIRGMYTVNGPDPFYRLHARDAEQLPLRPREPGDEP